MRPRLAPALALTLTLTLATALRIPLLNPSPRPNPSPSPCPNPSLGRTIRGWGLGLGLGLGLGWGCQSLALADEAVASPLTPVDRCAQRSTATGMQIKCERHGLRQGQRLFGCDAGEACVSTSAVKSPSKFASPWQVPEGKTAGIFDALVAEAKKAGVDVAVADGSDAERQYMWGTVRGGGGATDDVEFLVVPKEGLVFYRSCTRITEYVYPFQQPINDQGEANRKRMEGIRTKLNLEKATDDTYDKSAAAAMGMSSMPYI
eukprot:CAMPEP_0118867452 /NCGR_PEP_ID=MMETSP1163-20130328/11052_1 /TAXON_ID=124430 /ORGANISM="Phaeomonas parva, Strain CCMP2877" /LENGTH=260 /DNA_ID=CAMNT_0006801867 /DNA_START=108 /DNA_END=890 /DNA_ORIENTATION=+